MQPKTAGEPEMGSQSPARSEPKLIIKPKSPAETKSRQEAAQQVLLAFDDLPRARLLCFFDSEDCWAFKDEITGLGKANRGISGPITKSSNFQGWPWEVIERIYPSYASSDNEAVFDFVTYLHDSSCEDPVGMTMTFAHELQHFVQWGTMRGAFEANDGFRARRLEAGAGFDSHELPIEKDARIVAKRIAIRIHGREAVDHYIARNIANPVNDGDSRNWRFIDGLDVSKPYDVEVETTLFGDKLERPVKAD
jgi:hypothetical protein